MWGATIPTVYYGFYSDPKLQAIYCTVVSAPSLRIGLGELSDKSAGIGAGLYLLRCHLPSEISYTKISSLSCRNVRSIGVVCCCFCLAWCCSARVDGTKPAHESKLDDFDGITQSHWCCVLRL